MSRAVSTKRYNFEPDYAVPPGETLQETIDHFGMTQRDLAVRTGLAPKTVNEIIKGKAPITPETAVMLERVTGIPSRMWNELETNYRAQLAKIADRERLAADLQCLKKKQIPVSELVHRKIIGQHQEKASLLHAVLQFFGVSSPESWDKLWMSPTAAFRKSPRFEACPGAIAAWLRLGELDARKIETHPYDRERFERTLGAIRQLTNEPPQAFQPRMVSLAADVGVAVVFVQEISKCPVSGVARWLTPGKALIQLNLRYKTEDHFWFSFFHEAGHILHDGKKEVFIDDGHCSDEREQRANRFAADFLIPPNMAGHLQTLRTRTAVRAFADRIGVAPGIVVGRLQHEGIILHSYLNDLKRHFSWAQQ